MKSGELLVSGIDHVRIPLQGKPGKVEVCFKNKHDHIPCNPPPHEELEWEIHHHHKHHGKYELIIKWNVSGVREIIWSVHQ